MAGQEAGSLVTSGRFQRVDFGAAIGAGLGGVLGAGLGSRTIAGLFPRISNVIGSDLNASSLSFPLAALLVSGSEGIGSGVGERMSSAGGSGSSNAGGANGVGFFGTAPTVVFARTGEVGIGTSTATTTCYFYSDGTASCTTTYNTP